MHLKRCMQLLVACRVQLDVFKGRCGSDRQQGSLRVQVRCLMCSPEEMTKLVPIMRECTCVRNVIIMDRQAQALADDRL